MAVLVNTFSVSFRRTGPRPIGSPTFTTSCWCRYVSFVRPGHRALIGTLGAFATAGRPSVCEIGYSILAPYEGQGFATEGARALIDYLRVNAELSSIIAHSFPSLPASIRVMEKCGMVFDGEGEEPGTVRYRLHLRKLP
jgi:ribosomal-protein-alanine N-acetyltransferase